MKCEVCNINELTTYCTLKFAIVNAKSKIKEAMEILESD